MFYFNVWSHLVAAYFSYAFRHIASICRHNWYVWYNWYVLVRECFICKKNFL